MNTTQLNPLFRALSVSATRRGIPGVLIGGLLLTGPSAESEANKRGGRKAKKRRRRNKRQHQRPNTRVDATCAGPANITFKEDNGTVRFAQTFTAIATGELIKAALDLGKDPGSEGDYILRLSPLNGAGFPTNDILVETTVANAEVPETFSTVPFTFADPFPVKAGEAYALVLTRPGGQLQWDGNLNNPCAGQAFVSPDQTAPFTAVDVADTDFIVTIVITS